MFEQLPKHIATAMNLALDAGALRALISWPKFSWTSYRMVSGLVRQDVKPATVIDVGANVGQFSVAARMLWTPARLYAFEPEPRSLEQLRRNLRGFPDATVFGCALGPEPGVAALHVNRFRHSSSLLPLASAHRQAFPHATDAGTVEVAVDRLDRVMRDLPLPPPVLLKIDVQGFEPEVLAGARGILHRIDYTLLESSFRPLYEGESLFLDVVDRMRALGFRFSRPVGWLAHPRTDEILQMDCLFERDERYSVGPAR